MTAKRIEDPAHYAAGYVLGQGRECGHVSDAEHVGYLRAALDGLLGLERGYRDALDGLEPDAARRARFLSCGGKLNAYGVDSSTISLRVSAAEKAAYVRIGAVAVRTFLRQS